MIGLGGAANRLGRTRRARNDEDRILPLINVVFLLLIFFMIAGRMTASDPFQVTPPNSRSEAAVESLEMVVAMAADGRLGLDGVELDRAALRSAITERLARAPDTAVRLKADGAAGALGVVEVMELLREAGVRQLRLLTVGGDA